MAPTFAALSSKGGIGKTTTLANIAGLLADTGELMVDGDTKYCGHAAVHLAHIGPQRRPHSGPMKFMVTASALFPSGGHP